MQVEPKPNKRLTIQMDELWSFVDDKGNKYWVWLAIDAETREIVGCYSAIVLANQRRNYGNCCLVSIANVRLFTLIYTRLILSYYPVNVIGQSAKKQAKPTIFRDSTVRYDNEYQD